MDERLLVAIQRELDDGYGVYALTATEALLVRLPRATHRSAVTTILRGSVWWDHLAVAGSARYGRVWLDGDGRVNVEHRSTRY